MATGQRIIEALSEGLGQDSRRLIMEWTADGWTRRAWPEVRTADMVEAFHYIDSGIDYLYLLNGFTLGRHPHGEAVAIKDGRGLHAAVAGIIITSPASIRGQELRFLRSVLHLGQDEM